jgi:hypothetical protein
VYVFHSMKEDSVFSCLMKLVSQDFNLLYGPTLAVKCYQCNVKVPSATALPSLGFLSQLSPTKYHSSLSMFHSCFPKLANMCSLKCVCKLNVRKLIFFFIKYTVKFVNVNLLKCKVRTGFCVR